MHEYTAIARLSRKAVRHLQSVISKLPVSDEMSTGGTQTHQEAITDNERVDRVGVIVHCRHISVPAAEVCAIE